METDEPKVVNIKRRPRPRRYVYIGRRVGQEFHYGNPFSHLEQSHTIKCRDRKEACEEFEAWIMGWRHCEVEPKRRQWIIDNLPRIKGRDLGCYCAPKRCHGHLLLQLANTDWKPRR